jgi:putative transposase
VKRALFGLFQGAVGKDVVSRAWRKVKVDWDAWCARSLAEEDIVRLILDGTVIRTRLDKKATNISVLAAIGVRRDGQKILLSIRHMGGESTAAWRQFLDDLDARGLKRPDFVIVDGAPGLEAALTALWGDELPIQRCTVHKHRNLLGHAPKHMHDELTEDYRDMIYADDRRRGGDPPQGVPAQMAPQVPGRGRQPRGSRGAAVRLHPPRSVAMEVGPDHQRHRAPERGVPTPHQDPDRAALRRDRAHAALGAARLRPDPAMRKVDGWETLSQPIEPLPLDLAA